MQNLDTLETKVEESKAEAKEEKKADYMSETENKKKNGHDVKIKMETNGKNVKEEVKEEKMVDSEEEVKSEENDEDGEDEDEELEVKAKKAKKGATREVVPQNWLFRGARQLFIEPNVIRNEIKESDLKFKDIDEEGLIQFLCQENGFSEDRVRSGIKRIKDSKGRCAQTRIDSFFKTMPSTNKAPAPPPPSSKRASAGKASVSKRGRPK